MVKGAYLFFLDHEELCESFDKMLIDEKGYIDKKWYEDYRVYYSPTSVWDRKSSKYRFKKFTWTPKAEDWNKIYSIINRKKNKTNKTNKRSIRKI